MTLKNENLHILFLTKWFPNEKDPQLGVFIEKHAKAVSMFCKVSVLHLIHSPVVEEKGFRVVINEDSNYLAVTVYYNHSSVKFFFLSYIYNVLWYFRAFRKGNKIIKQKSGKYQLIHVHILTRPGVIALFYKLCRGIPYVITEHWTGYMTSKFRKKGRFEKFITRFVFRQADYATCVSSSLKRHMLLNKFWNKNFTIIPNIIDERINENARKKENDKIIILTAADLVDSKKNISGVIKAIYFLSKQYSNFEYHIIGGGSDEQSLKKLAKDLGLYDKFVFFLGRKPNQFVLDYIPQVDFGIVNSNVETFSVFTAELLAQGKPVIVTRCGGPEEYIENKTGILILPGNQHQLQNAIEYMMEHYAHYDSEYLRQSIKKRFNSELIGHKFYEIYLKIVG